MIKLTIQKFIKLQVKLKIINLDSLKIKINIQIIKTKAWNLIQIWNWKMNVNIKYHTIIKSNKKIKVNLI